MTIKEDAHKLLKNVDSIRLYLRIAFDTWQDYLKFSHMLSLHHDGVISEDDTMSLINMVKKKTVEKSYVELVFFAHLYFDNPSINLAYIREMFMNLIKDKIDNGEIGNIYQKVAMDMLEEIIGKELLDYIMLPFMEELKC